MGSLKSLALAGAMAVGVSAAAAAADYAPSLPPPPPHEPLGLKGSIGSGSGIYLRGDIGVGLTKIGKYDQEEVRSVGGTFFGQSDENSSYFAGAGIGYRFNNWFRVDGTLEYRGGATIGVNDRVDFNTNFGRVAQTNTYKGNLTSMVALFNAYVDLGTWNCLTPYLGAGIGYTTNRISGLTDQGVQSVNLGGGNFSAGSSTLGTAANGDKSGLAWALMAGVGYEVNKNLTLEAGYRYLNLGDSQSGLISNAFIAGTSRPLRAKEIESHDFKIGMRWNFGEPECCGPVERPVSYAPAPTVIRKY